jgi:ATP-dependent HslUV protease subunit HslV
MRDRRPLSDPETHATTVLLVRRDGRVAMAGDGQVTMNNTVVKSHARKVRRLGDRGEVLVGFAGAAADGLALLTRLEGKLEEYRGNLERAVVELAKDWRTDRALRQLQAMILVSDKDKSFLLNGSGDLLQPDEGGVLAIGSGGNFALAAAQALLRFTALSAGEIAREAMTIAAQICVFTNETLTVEEL